jgi:hypothetical protein
MIALLPLLTLLAWPAWAQDSPVATQSTPSETSTAALAAKLDALAIAFSEQRELWQREKEALTVTIREEAQARAALAAAAANERMTLALRTADEQRWELSHVVSVLALLSILVGFASYYIGTFIAAKLLPVEREIGARIAPLERQISEQKLNNETFAAESRASRASLGADIRELRNELHNVAGGIQQQFSDLTSKQEVNISMLKEAKTELETQKRALEQQIATSNNEFYRWIGLLWEKSFPDSRFPDRVAGAVGIAHQKSGSS